MRAVVTAAVVVLLGRAISNAQQADSVASPLDTLVNSTTVDVSLTLSQSAYSDNWVGGDAGNFSWIALSNIVREIYSGETWHSRNTFKLSYGQTHTQDPETKTWRKPAKSTDEIDLESLQRYLKWPVLPPYASLRIQSQFEDASQPGHRLYLNPIRFTEAVGLSRQLYKAGDDQLLTRAGGALRQLIQRSFTDSTFAATRRQTSTDGGIEWVSDAALKIPGSSIVFKSKLSAFKAFYNSTANDLEGMVNEDYWKAIDADWDNTFSAQVSKYIGVNLNLRWIYDKEVDLAGRFKQTLSVGFSWKNL